MRNNKWFWACFVACIVLYDVVCYVEVVHVVSFVH